MSTVIPIVEENIPSFERNNYTVAIQPSLVAVASDVEVSRVAVAVEFSNVVMVLLET